MRGPDHELYLSFAYPCQPPMGRELVGRVSKQRVDGMGMQGVGKKVVGKMHRSENGAASPKIQVEMAGMQP